MNNLIFWIIVCSWLIPLGIRMYNRSRARRIHDGTFRGPGYRQQHLPGPGYPQQDYPGYPEYPGQPHPGPANPQQDYPGYQSPPSVIRPAESAPQAGPPSSPSSPTPFPSASGTEPQGYRARKLAELDAKFSNGEIAMEDYMKQRGEIMNG
ncbi:hypothetical protein J2Y66_000171 [Paenarthrobacter nitroguajacolicus]|uniref:hypothetical protein n=1 Tax=Paenarthrobacter nitroguajacolicus TaxID=211146 RepID=UPI0028614150|nr:hypothetical protein [Paenarthrobacter nitroguajacolicus]MDR6985708.1 hypothetical protein [Paenarthrobacter nitroguajacolicus]